MTSLITSANDYMRNLPADRGAFKVVLSLPIVGIVAQLWKRQVHVNDIHSNLAHLRKMENDNPETWAPGEREHTLYYNSIGAKIVRLAAFDRDCSTNGLTGDVALLTAGIATAILVHPVALVVGAVGLACLVTRLIFPARDINLLNQLEAHRPPNDNSYWDFRRSESTE